jgi:hypothetical protein
MMIQSEHVAPEYNHGIETLMSRGISEPSSQASVIPHAHLPCMVKSTVAKVSSRDDLQTIYNLNTGDEKS